MAPFRTAFNGYAIKFSPFEEGRVAVATAQNFGIIGNGRQYVLQVMPPPSCGSQFAVWVISHCSSTCSAILRFSMGCR